MKVLQLIPSLAAGGAEVVTAGLVRELASLGVEVELTCLYGAGDRAESLRAGGIRVVDLNKRPGMDLGFLRRFVTSMRLQSPDVIHSHMHVLKYSLLAGLGARRMTRIHTLHTLCGHERSRITHWTHQIGKLYQVTPVAVSNQVAASFQLGGIYGNVVVIPNGVDVAEFRPDAGRRKKLREKLQISDASFVVVHVARFNPVKNHRFLVDAFAEIASRHPEARLLLIGDGEMRPEIAEQIARAGIGPNVLMLGVRKDVGDLLQASDMFVLPSTVEGNPIAMLEAMASGLPVVCSRVGGIPDVIRHEEDGLLFEPNDMSGFLRSCSQVIDNPTLRTSLGQAARQRVEAEFSLRATAQAYLELYAASRSEVKGS